MSLVATLTQSLRTRYEPKTVDKNEMLPSRYGVWDFFQQQANVAGGIMTPQIKKTIEMSAGNTVQIPVLNAKNVTITNVRSCTVVPDENTSALVTLVFATYGFGFTMYPARHYNNDISYQADFDKKLEEGLLKLASTLDGVAAAQLETKRNQYFPAEITAYYTEVGNALQITQAEKDDFFNNAEAIMQQMDYYNMIHVVGSTSLTPMINRLRAQGAGNQVNQNFQFNPYQWHTSNRITNDTGVAITGYLVPDGNVAVHSRNQPDNMMRAKTGNGKEWGTAQMPIVNLNMDTYYYDDCTDLANADPEIQASGVDHLTRTKMEAFAFDIDLCFMTSYNSNAAGRFSPDVKFEISNT